MEPYQQGQHNQQQALNFPPPDASGAPILHFPTSAPLSNPLEFPQQPQSYPPQPYPQQPQSYPPYQPQSYPPQQQSYAPYQPQSYPPYQPQAYPPNPQSGYPPNIQSYPPNQLHISPPSSYDQNQSGLDYNYSQPPQNQYHDRPNSDPTHGRQRSATAPMRPQNNMPESPKNPRNQDFSSTISRLAGVSGAAGSASAESSGDATTAQPAAKQVSKFGKIFNAASKLEELKQYTVDRAVYSMEKAQQYFESSDTSCDAPHFSFSKEDILDKLKTDSNKWPVDDLEILFYIFRDFSDFEPILALERFELLFFKNPQKQLPALLLSQIYKMFLYFESSLTFSSFVLTLTKIFYGTSTDKANFVFYLLSDQSNTINPQVAPNLVRMTSNIFLNRPVTVNFPNQPLNIQSFSHFYFQNESLFSDAFGLFSYLFNYIQKLKNLKKNEEPEKEGFLLKSVSGASWSKHFCRVNNGFFMYYQKRFTRFLNDNYIPSKKVREYSIVSRSVELSEVSVKSVGGNQKNGFIFELSTPNGYRRKFAAATSDECTSWIHAIGLWNLGSSGLKTSYGNFGVKSDISGKWLVDGEQYFLEVYKYMEAATEEIFITDWFLSPEVFLVRKDEDGIKWKDTRLYDILKRKADQGVFILVLIWNETKIAVNLNSEYVKLTLENLSTNIKVIRHPIVTPMKWSHHQKTIIIDQEVAFVGGLDLAFGRWDTQAHYVAERDYNNYIWEGKDYFNPLVMGVHSVNEPKIDYYDRKELCRMPWHDVCVRVDGEIAKDVARNFIQRWNHHKDVLKDIKLPYLFPKSSFAKINFFKNHEINFNENGPIINFTGHNVFDTFYNAKAEVLRSVCNWSCGQMETEKSILDATIAEIQKAKCFIYIESQFFMSSFGSNNSLNSNGLGGLIENKVAEKLYEKICYAIDKNEKFKVIVILPETPDGKYKESATVRYLMQWNYSTISKNNGGSLLERLDAICRAKNVSVSNYISFNSLRNYGKNFYGNFVTSQVYIHTKLLIVDDCVAIVGSANYNDRSFLGNRDSEIALRIEDVDKVMGNMGRIPFPKSDSVRKLRMELWKEHLGIESLSEDERTIEDPVCGESWWGLWMKVAEENGKIFQSIFPSVPSDFIKNFVQMREREAEESRGGRMSPTEKESMLRGVKGHLIRYPVGFLADEDLSNYDKKNVDLFFASDDVFT